MHDDIDLPDLAIVRALTSGGPFLTGDTISVAFVTPTAGRLVAHALDRPASTRGPARLPETISVAVLHAAGPYGVDDVLTLSFVDPNVARIHPTPYAERAPAVPVAAPPPPPPPPSVSTFVASPLRAVPHGVRISLAWNEERVRRFVQVTDKLFTVDRLGWYRHAFTMRLLIPDTIACGDPEADAHASRHLRALRSAVLETLGRPLLAAFMPSFSVTPEWLDTMDGAETATALAGLRAAISPFVTDGARPSSCEGEASTQGVIGESELAAAPATSVEALLPLLIADTSAFDDVTAALRGYRSALVELFGQTAGSAEAVRLTQMAQPNHTLDDRLWHLVGVVSERFGDLVAV